MGELELKDVALLQHFFSRIEKLEDKFEMVIDKMLYLEDLINKGMSNDKTSLDK